jgi:hypothetical protein
MQLPDSLNPGDYLINILKNMREAKKEIHHYPSDALPGACFSGIVNFVAAASAAAGLRNTSAAAIMEKIFRRKPKFGV